MEKFVAEFLSIVMLGAFLLIVSLIGFLIKKIIQALFGKDFFVKNKDNNADLEKSCIKPKCKNSKKRNKKFNIEEIISCLSCVLGFVSTFAICSYYNDWSEEVWINIIGFPLQIIVGSLVLGLIIFCLLWIIYFLLCKIFSVLKILPHKNYHILGYISFFYLFFVTFILSENAYAHYEILRWLITCFSAWTFVNIYNKNVHSFWLLIFAAITILFNPIVKIELEQDVWMMIDFITLIIFLVYAIKNKNTNA